MRQNAHQLFTNWYETGLDSVGFVRKPTVLVWLGFIILKSIWFGLVWFRCPETGFEPNQTVPIASCDRHVSYCCNAQERSGAGNSSHHGLCVRVGTNSSFRPWFFCSVSSIGSSEVGDASDQWIPSLAGNISSINFFVKFLVHRVSNEDAYSGLSVQLSPLGSGIWTVTSGSDPSQGLVRSEVFRECFSRQYIDCVRWC